mgnify:FL=1
MNNMWAGEPGKGLFNMRYDFEKSHDSYIYDKNTQREYLDFFGMFSSIPLGYNHSIFSEKSFVDEIKKVSKFKIVNCEFASDEYDRFYKRFMEFVSCNGLFTNVHFCSTGALAVECGIKAAMYHSKKENPKILSVKNNFHGIMSYGNIVTTRFFPVTTRLDGFPGDIWPEFSSEKELECLLGFDESISGVMVEPIQSTYGDNHLDIKFLKSIRRICSKYKVPLIFDEVQTGFCTTGKVWYFEHLGIEPDIVIFGKKAQVCGILTKEDFSDIFETKRLYTTWDGELLDMIRSTHIIDFIEKNNIMDKFSLFSKEFICKLKEIDSIQNVRGIGGLIAFDFRTADKRDEFFDHMYNNGMLCNPTGEKSVRLRPHLTTTKEDFEKGLQIIRESLNG